MRFDRSMPAKGEEKRLPTLRHFFLDFVNSFLSFFFGNKSFMLLLSLSLPSSVDDALSPKFACRDGTTSLNFVSEGGKIGVEETCRNLIELRVDRMPIRPKCGGDVVRLVVYIVEDCDGGRTKRERGDCDIATFEKKRI